MNGQWFGNYAGSWWGGSSSTQPDVPMPTTAGAGYSFGSFPTHRPRKADIGTRGRHDDRDLIDILTFIAPYL